jgi:predicted transposase/invertase (TIGR01784 family)
MLSDQHENKGRCEKVMVEDLKYGFMRDKVFRTLFVNYAHFLKWLVAAILKINLADITQFEIKNSEIPSDNAEDKLARLDVNVSVEMAVGTQLVDIEVQVANTGYYVERSMFYAAREFSSALPTGGEYSDLPRVVVISILGFTLFTDTTQYHCVFRFMERDTGRELSDKMELHYIEVPKLPEVLDTGNELEVMLALFRAETDEDVARIDEMGVPIVSEVIDAYRGIVLSSSPRALARMREDGLTIARTMIGDAIRENNKKWQTITEQITAEKDAELAKLAAEKDAELARQAAEKDAEIAQLLAMLDASGE